MGLEASCTFLRTQLEARFDELRGRTTFGKKNLPRNVSAPWFYFLPGEVPDQIESAQSAGRVPREVRWRYGAAHCRILGRSYTEAEGYVTELMSLLYWKHHGRLIIGNPRFLSSEQGDLAQYGEHFQLPFWIGYQVPEWEPPALAKIEAVGVLNAGVNAEGGGLPPNL